MSDMPTMLPDPSATVEAYSVEVRRLIDHIKWAANAVHQAHHLYPNETTVAWQDCPRATCREAARTLWGGQHG